MSTAAMSNQQEASRDGDQFVETPDIDGAYPRLNADQIATLERGGSRRKVQAGDVLIREGEPSQDLFVILAGRVAILADDEDGRPALLRIHGSGRFLGELGTLEGQASFFTAQAMEDGQMLVVPAALVRSLVARDPLLSDLILRAFLVRRCMLIEQGIGLRIVGSCYSPDTARLREFAARNRLPHRWLDTERDGDAERLLERFGVSVDETPLVIWGNGKVLRNPTNTELARLVGLPVPGVIADEYDLLVIGAGPAGLGASVYGAADGLRTATVELTAPGGQAGTSSRIENYLGFPAGISGAELADRAILQADKFGARIMVSAQAAGLDCNGELYRVRLADGTTVASRAVVVATGARYRKLGVPGIEAFEGNGIYYAATYLEALMCGAGPVVIVGGGNSAGQAAVFLSERVSQVHLLVRGPDLRESMSRYLVDQIEQQPRVTVHTRTEVIALDGDGAPRTLKQVVAVDRRSSEQFAIETSALFVFIGAAPNTAWLRGVVDLDDKGFIPTGWSARHSHGNGHRLRSQSPPRALQTSLPGIFAAGDVRSGSVKRVASAVGEGAMAVRQVHEYLGGV